MLCAFFTLTGYGQDEKSYSDFLTRVFVKDLNSLRAGNNVAPFVSAFAQKFEGEIITIQINGDRVRHNFDKASLSNSLSRPVKSPALVTKWEIVEFDLITFRNNTGIATFESKTLVYSHDTLISTGTNLVRVVSTFKDGQYLIKYLSVVQIADETYRGKCYAEIVDLENKKVQVNVYHPNGTDYDVIRDSIVIGSTPTGLTTFTNQGANSNTYYWNPKSGPITTSREGTGEIGNATNRNRAIIYVLTKVYTAQCSVIYPTAKKK